MEGYKNLKNERIGNVNYNKWGSKNTIIEYKNSKNIIVKFDNGYVLKTRYDHFIKGEIRSPYCKTVHEVGYLGEGKYEVLENNKITIVYKMWASMLQRCYDEQYRIKYPTYLNCIVFEEWHNFQNFAKWYEENYYIVDNEQMCLDKDILHKYNKVYSPENCIFVPERINKLFIKNDKYRGTLPIGVSFDKSTNKYTAQYNTLKNNKRKNIYLGNFNTPIQAFNTYKKYKEKYIKQVAEEYKDKIPYELYNAMKNWIVDIND